MTGKLRTVLAEMQHGDGGRRFTAAGMDRSGGRRRFLDRSRPLSREVVHVGIGGGDFTQEKRRGGVWNLLAAEEAGKIGLSRACFCSRLKEETGLTFRQFKNRARLKAILAELNHLDSKPLKAIPLDRLGFDTYAHFTTWFKRQTGLTPRQWLRQRRCAVE